MDEKLIEKKLIEDIGRIIKTYYKDLPIKSRELWKDGEIYSVQEIFEILNQIFNKEEEKRKNDNYETGMYRNEMKNFAIALSMRIISEYRQFNNRDFYIRLFEQKYMAYAFFHIIDKGYAGYEIIRDKLRGIDKIYMGLVRFYTTFYGTFADNEEAIRLLCKYYNLQKDLPEDEKRIKTMGVEKKLSRHCLLILEMQVHLLILVLLFKGLCR